MKKLNEDDLEYIYQSTKDIWLPVKNKSMFITGGTGFFGKWLLESFVYINNKLQLNADITVLTRNPDIFLEAFPFYKQLNNVDFLKGDIIDFVYPDKSFHYIIHAATAADAVLNTDNLSLMKETIITGTKHVLEFANTKSIESFLFISSGAVYGKQPEHIKEIGEEDSFYIDVNNPIGVYADAKKEAELVSAEYYLKKKLPVKIARGFAFVGPYLPLDKHFAIGNFILNSLNDDDIIIKGDGTPYRSYLYSADLAIWLWTILLKGENNLPYNVGSDDAYSIAQIAAMVAEGNKKVSVKILGQSKPGASIERYVPSINRAKKIGLKVGIDIKSAILKTKKFHESV